MAKRAERKAENPEAPWWAGLVVFGLIYAAHWIQSTNVDRVPRAARSRRTMGGTAGRGTLVDEAPEYKDDADHATPSSELVARGDEPGEVESRGDGRGQGSYGGFRNDRPATSEGVSKP